MWLQKGNIHRLESLGHQKSPLTPLCQRGEMRVAGGDARPTMAGERRRGGWATDPPSPQPSLLKGEGVKGKMVGHAHPTGFSMTPGPWSLVKVSEADGRGDPAPTIWSQNPKPRTQNHNRQLAGGDARVTGFFLTPNPALLTADC